MAINRVPGEIMYIDLTGDTLNLVYTDVSGELQISHFYNNLKGEKLLFRHGISK